MFVQLREKSLGETKLPCSAAYFALRGRFWASRICGGEGLLPLAKRNLVSRRLCWAGARWGKSFWWWVGAFWELSEVEIVVVWYSIVVLSRRWAEQVLGNRKENCVQGRRWRGNLQTNLHSTIVSNREPLEVDWLPVLVGRNGMSIRTTPGPKLSGIELQKQYIIITHDPEAAA